MDKLERVLRAMNDKAIDYLDRTISCHQIITIINAGLQACQEPAPKRLGVEELDRTQIRKEVCEEILKGFPRKVKCGKKYPKEEMYFDGRNTTIDRCVKAVLWVRDKDSK